MGLSRADTILAVAALILLRFLPVFAPLNTSSTEPVLRSRLLPRISFRFLLLLTAVAAILATLARLAGDGGAFARAILFGIAVPLSVLGVGGILFLFSWTAASLTLETNELPPRDSPFAEGQLPPQTLPPRDRPS